MNWEKSQQNEHKLGINNETGITEKEKIAYEVGKTLLFYSTQFAAISFCHSAIFSELFNLSLKTRLNEDPINIYDLAVNLSHWSWP